MGRLGSLGGLRAPDSVDYRLALSPTDHSSCTGKVGNCKAEARTRDFPFRMFDSREPLGQGKAEASPSKRATGISQGAASRMSNCCNPAGNNHLHYGNYAKQGQSAASYWSR